MNRNLSKNNELKKVFFREATMSDANLLLRWRNDPSARKYFRNPQRVSLGEHLSWLKGTLNNPTRNLYIIMDSAANSIGQLRFDVAGDSAEISITIGQAFRGKGYGQLAIKNGVSWFFEIRPHVKTVIAEIKENNIASLSAFKQAGFKNYKKKARIIYLRIKNMRENKFQNSNKFFNDVKKIIPLASQTFSKSYLQYIKGAAPLFITHGKGCRVWDVDGNEYIDFINGLLPVILGYQYKPVNEAIKKQLKKGITFSLPSPLEYELAQLLIKHIPCAEMVRFGKNGSDVTTGAIRLARAITGKDHVAMCGYHGWHDWCIGTTTRNLGVPKSMQNLTHKFIYNDIKSLDKIFKKHKGKIAAVIMEPMNYVEPKDGFLRQVKELTHQNGALLIFDEVITGFRFGMGGAQKLFGVIPDLATFGKSMANGMPISALVGKRKYMERISDIFYSFTNGGETLSIAAAIATIKEMERKDVIKHIWKLGKYLQDGTNVLLKKHGLDDIIKVQGKPCWQVFIISGSGKYSDLEIKSFIQQELLQAGFLWYGQHNMSFSHTRDDVDKLLAVYKIIFTRLKNLIETGNLRESLRGEPITNIFKIR